MTPEFLIANITLFVLAIFLGFELITKVPATLHTPLMSGANAISGISIIGALTILPSKTIANCLPIPVDVALPNLLAPTLSKEKETIV